MKILVAPLNWGLGHATRCIPVINELLLQKHQVMLCAEGHGRMILGTEFPHLSFIDIPGISVNYPGHGSMALSMLRQSYSFIKAIQEEQKLLQSAIREHGITHVISDSRFGLYSKIAKSVIITHQIRIQGGLLEPLLYRFNRYYLSKFREIWIPDNNEEPRLSGRLSDANGLGLNVRSIGILSRFGNHARYEEKKYEYIALLSGPEPQRTLLEKKLEPLLKNSGKNYLIIRGLPGKDPDEDEHHINSIAAGHLESILHPETLLIARPGYSTLMDMAALGHKKLLFVPTPGQTEQEYLAKHLALRYGCITVNQKALQMLPEVATSGFTVPVMNPGLLRKALSAFTA